MPVTYSVDHRKQRVYAVGTGTVSFADLVAYIEARVKDGVYDYDQLVDLSDAEFDTGPLEVIDAVKQARAHLNERPIPFTAVVARTGSATYGLVRQQAVLFGFEGATIEVVDTTDGANVWLDRMQAERQREQTPE